MSDGVRLQPDAGEVLQEEAPEAYPLTVLDTCVTEVKTPVRVKLLPTLPGGTKTRTVDTTKPVQLLGADPYRARALVTSFDADFLLFNETSAQDPSAMSRQPKGIPLDLHARTELYVMAQAGTTAISCATERWAAGDA